MKIGIIAEGHSDRAVIVNILEGVTGIDSSDIIPILPIYALDETDLANKSKQEFGGWSAIKNECNSKEFIIPFYERLGDNFLVIHLDTAESAQYGIIQPNKDNHYTHELRKLIISQIIDWMNIDISDSLLFAIAVEEMDAWILTILEARDSSKTANAKKRLEYIKGFKPGKLKPDYDLYLEYSLPFKEDTAIKKNMFLTRNESLNVFCQEIIAKILPKIKN